MDLHLERIRDLGIWLEAIIQRSGGGVVTYKILLPSPVPWIGDLGLGDWGPGLDNKCLPSSLLKTACGNSKNSSTFCFARESPFRSRDVKDLLFVSVSLPWLPGWRDLNI